MEVFSTDAKDQGECNSCAEFALTAALETCKQRVINFPAFMIDPPRGLSTQNLLEVPLGVLVFMGVMEGRASDTCNG